MKKNILSLTLVAFLIFPVVALAQCEVDTNIVLTTIASITDMLKIILYATAGLFIIFAAFTFITAAGDPEKVKTARMYVLYALTGVLVAVIAGGLVDLVCEIV